jgi:hypothetical protein
VTVAEITHEKFKNGQREANHNNDIVEPVTAPFALFLDHCAAFLFFTLIIRIDNAMRYAARGARNA